jgi:probable F420-dependent oxidoreductase
MHSSDRGNRLRWSIAVPEPRFGVTVSPAFLAAAATNLESAGFDGIWVSDHPLPLDLSIPRESGGAPDAKLGAGHQTWDPFAALAWLSQATTRVKLHTNAVVLPYRNPFITAKAAATVQHLSGGRLIMSLAAGYLKAEFDALGVDIDHRTELMDEGVSALKAAWAGKPFAMHTSGWKVNGNAALPAPDPHPTLWRAGNSHSAIAYAARFCDGWTPFEVSEEHARATRTAALEVGTGLRERIGLFRKLCAESGRPPSLDVSLVRTSWGGWTARPKQQVRDELAELLAMGVTWIVTTLATNEETEFARRLDTLRTLVL